MMKKILRIGCMLLLVALVLTGCSTPEPVNDEPTEEQTATPAPVWTQPPPDPTITPRVLTGDIEEPEPGATLLLIDPIDKPTRPPVVFEPYELVTEGNLGVTFEVPGYWERIEDPSVLNAVAYQEPINDIRNEHGAQSQIVVQVVTGSTAQTVGDAEAYIDSLLNNLLETYGNPDFSSKADNRMMGIIGKYVTYRVDYVPEGGDPENPIRMRGRILVVPVDRKLYMVRYICPADYNSDYEAAFKKVRDTIKEIN